MPLVMRINITKVVRISNSTRMELPSDHLSFEGWWMDFKFITEVNGYGIEIHLDVGVRGCRDGVLTVDGTTATFQEAP